MTIKNIKKRKVCPCCGHITIEEKSTIVCDNCGKEVPYSENTNFLELGKFYYSDIAMQRLHFCSWKCLREFIINHKEKLLDCDFMTLPYLHREDYENFLKEFLRCDK